MIISTVASTLLYLSQLFSGSIVRETNDFSVPSLPSLSSDSSSSNNNIAGADDHGKLSKWSADNKARFLTDLEHGKAGDWVIGEWCVIDPATRPHHTRQHSAIKQQTRTA